MTDLAEIAQSRHVLAVPDAEKTAAFFVDALGFERVPVGDLGWRFVRQGACFLMLGSCPDAIPPSELGDHSYFAYLVVADVDACHARLVARGATVRRSPEDKPWGMRELALETPDGHRMMLGQRLGAPLSARATFEKYGLEINAHDFDRLAPLIADDCQFWFSSGTHRGLIEARRAFEKTWAAIQGEVYSVSSVEWLAESESAAVCTYTFGWEGLVAGERRSGRGRGTTCLRREAGGWKIVHEHLSPHPPAA